MAYNVKNKLEDNIRAIEIVLAWENGLKLNQGHIEQLKRYSGFGGIKPILFPAGSLQQWEQMGATESDLNLHPSIMALHEMLRQHFQDEDYQRIIKSIQESCLTAFYTPAIIPRALYSAMNQHGLQPKRLYEPSAGAGVFITEATAAFNSLVQVQAVEKDDLTGRVLSAIGSLQPIPVRTNICGLEETSNEENGKFDLAVSNIPFGDYSVYDPDISDRSLTGRIHNYFFTKGLDKLAEGGIMAYLTTDAFLNTPGNQSAREYLFRSADFISLTLLPDNLMHDTANTLAPTHLLIVQKNTTKEQFSNDELNLLTTTTKENEYGKYNLNNYIAAGGSEIIMGTPIAGKNQYGKATNSITFNQDMDRLLQPLAEKILDNLRKNLNQRRFQECLSPKESKQHDGPCFTYLQIPPLSKASATIQLDMFGASAENINRAMDYITSMDATLIDKKSAYALALLREKNDDQKECLTIISAKKLKSKQFVFKVYSNVQQIHTSVQWMNERDLARAIDVLKSQLQDHLHHLDFEGESELEDSLGFFHPEDQILIEKLPEVTPGSLIIYQGKAGTIEKNEREESFFRPLNNQSHITFYEHYVRLRDGYLKLSSQELSGQQADDSFRQQVNHDYETLTSKFGILNSHKNQKLIAFDKLLGNTMLYSIEKRTPQGFDKADILVKSIVPKAEVFHTENCHDALARCLNDMGEVNIDFIQSATGKELFAIYQELIGQIYINPETLEWETADQLLSGNVVKKLQIAQTQVDDRPDDLPLKEALTALQAVQPPIIPFEVLDFNLGERWIPIEFYNSYASEIFQTDVRVTYIQSSDSFQVTSSERNAQIRTAYAVKPISGQTMYGTTLLQHALENTNPHFTYEVREGDVVLRKTDTVAIQQAFDKIEELRTGFCKWLTRLSQEDKSRIEKLYNETFNCFRLRKYNGSHLTFPGLDLNAIHFEQLYSIQKDAAWRLIQNRGGIIDHEVGLGKTITMIIAAMEMRRLKTALKPMILALKANVAEIAAIFRIAYPNAKVLSANEKDFEKKNRLRLFQEIKNNNWDCIVLSHDQFGKIPQSAAIQKEILESELHDIEKDLLDLNRVGTELSKKLLKGLQKRKRNLTTKIKKLTGDIEQKKDTGITFLEMGIDHLFVDESHIFKNLTYTTRHQNVAGLGNQLGSGRALNLLFAIREIQNKFDSDMCATFLSGTIISNSLTELYILFKYLIPRELKRQHINTFDSWAAVYAKKTTEIEFNVLNEIVVKSRFRHFIKVPELALTLNAISDYKTAEDVGIDRPDIDEVLVNIPLTMEEAEFTANLLKFAKTGDATLIGRERLTRNQEKGRMLIATNYALKMAVDLRLISEDYSDHTDNKINHCARLAKEYYQLSQEQKGTQVCFCDIGTPKPDAFNVYCALRDKLIHDMGIPAHEIAFIHDYPKDEQKNKLFKAINKGEIRFLLGSTSKAGTGCNFQDRIVAMHELDIPYRPSDRTQRIGRGIRKGNWLAKTHFGNKVKNFIYAKEKSLDLYKLNLIKNKLTFINQLKKSDINIRSIDEGAFDEQNGMSINEYIAILSGNTDLLDKEKLERQIAVLESSKTIHIRGCANARLELTQNAEKNKAAKAMLERIELDYQRYHSALTYQKDGTKSNPVKLKNFMSTDSEEIGRYLIDMFQKWNAGTTLPMSEKIGELLGFELYIRKESNLVIATDLTNSKTWENTLQLISPFSGITYSYNGGKPNVGNPKIAARIFLNAIDRVDQLKINYQKTIQDTQANMVALEAISQKPFEQEDKLHQLKAELEELKVVIMKDINQQDKMEEPVEQTPIISLTEWVQAGDQHLNVVVPLPQDQVLKVANGEILADQSLRPAQEFALSRKEKSKSPKIKQQ